MALNHSVLTSVQCILSAKVGRLTVGLTVQTMLSVKVGWYTANVVGCLILRPHECFCRLVPRKGAGPDLRREGGGKIDEYLMRLLHTGNKAATEAAQNLKVVLDSSFTRHPLSYILTAPHTNPPQ